MIYLKKSKVVPTFLCRYSECGFGRSHLWHFWMNEWREHQVAYTCALVGLEGVLCLPVLVETRQTRLYGWIIGSTATLVLIKKPHPLFLSFVWNPFGGRWGSVKLIIGVFPCSHDLPVELLAHNLNPRLVDFSILEYFQKTHLSSHSYSCTKGVCEWINSPPYLIHQTQFFRPHYRLTTVIRFWTVQLVVLTKNKHTQ